MNPREKISIVLVAVSILLILYPAAGRYSFRGHPSAIDDELFSLDRGITPDQLARMIVNEDSTLQMIDLRDEEEYNRFSIPGALSIPFDRFFELKPEKWLYNRDATYLFYSNDDSWSAYAVTLALGMGYENCFFLEGGLNDWFRLVMNSTFTGERISPRENALFETRRKASDFFTAINSLPDSLRIAWVEARRQAEKDLDGGCN